MRRIIWILPFTLILCASLFLHKPFRIWATQPLRKEILSCTESIGLPEMQLIIPEKTIKKFDGIYQYYRDNDFDGKSTLRKKFVYELKANNQWEKAQMVFKGDTFKIKVKLHGNTPTQHVENDHYSLGVKLIGKKKINEMNRFNLVVYWRVRYNQDIIQYLSDKLGILYQPSKLFNVQINNRPNKLYFIENRINKNYFEQINKPNWVVFKHKSDHSFVYSNIEGDFQDYQIKIDTLIRKEVLDSVLADQIVLDFQALNQTIYEGDFLKIINYFDLDYLSKVMAFKYLFNDNGHGFTKQNLLMAYDTSERLFYPILHRDHNSNSFNSLSYDAVEGIDDSEIIQYESLFLTLISKNMLLKEKSNQFLEEFIRNNVVDELAIDSIMNVHNHYYLSSLIKSKLGQSQKHPSSKNITFLKSEYLN